MHYTKANIKYFGPLQASFLILLMILSILYYLYLLLSSFYFRLFYIIHHFNCTIVTVEFKSINILNNYTEQFLVNYQLRINQCLFFSPIQVLFLLKG